MAVLPASDSAMSYRRKIKINGDWALNNGSKEPQKRSAMLFVLLVLPCTRSLGRSLDWLLALEERG